jgi:hypothetical protein
MLYLLYSAGIAQVEEVPVGPRRSYVPPVYKQNENYDDRLGKLMSKNT